jgi:hypothetical protein
MLLLEEAGLMSRINETTSIEGFNTELFGSGKKKQGIA